MNEADEEFDRARQKSQGRFRSAFEAIFEKYGKLDDKDDIIDLVTGEIIVDNGRMREASVIELGDLLHYPDSPSGSFRSRSRKRKHRYQSPEFTGRVAGNGSLSPELMSYEEQLKQALSKQAAKQAAADAKPLGAETDTIQDLSDSDDSDAESLGLDFAPYSSLLSNGQIAAKGSMRRRANRRRGSSESNDLGYSYESSDSVGTEQETPIDTYFTSSIEQYLEKLRHQLAAPPTEHAHDIVDDADRQEMGDGSEDESEDMSDGNADSSESMSIQDSDGWSDQGSNRGANVFGHGHRGASTINPYAIPSSPRTMSPIIPSGAAMSFENMPPEGGACIEDIYASETCSQEPGFSSEEESVGSVCSSESVVIVQSHRQHGIPVYDQVEHAAQMLPYAQECSDGDCSEEEPVHDHSPFIPERRSGQEAFSDFSPNFVASLDHQTNHPQTYHPASLPPQPLAGTVNNRSQPVASSHWRNPLGYSDAAASVMMPGTSRSLAIRARQDNIDSYYDSSAAPARGPVLLKPQPVSPHVFFDFEAPSYGRAASAFKRSALYPRQPTADGGSDFEHTHEYDYTQH